ncbi:MAG: isocitrate lyase/phosphoenolpyruvate mutase family protein [Robiginitomaculum sp.]
MTQCTKKRKHFLALHKPGNPFVSPNPWDIGSARMMQDLGFCGLATTSSGFAATLGRRDYAVSHEETMAYASAIANTVDIPVSADLENGFGESVDAVAKTMTLAANTSLCGGSIEDVSGDADNPIYELSHATARIKAAVQAIKKSGFVLTARADGLLHGVTDLNMIIERLQAFEAAGADVLFAPGLPDLDAVHKVCSAVSQPVNVLVLFGLTQHSLDDFAQAGAARLSIGGALAFNAYGSLAGAADAMLGDGKFAGLTPTPGAKRIKTYLN